MTTTQTTTVGAVGTGLVRVKRSLRPGMRPTTPLAPDKELAWEPQYVADPGAESVTQLNMAAFGYRPFELTEFNGGKTDDLAYSGIHQVLTPDGVVAFRSVCERLADRVRDDDYIVSRRLRNADNLSKFVHGMMRDLGFLRRMSMIAGVPLVPHPISDASVCINYFEGADKRSAEDTSPQVAKWHCDGMTYVFVMQLNDSSDFDGGELMVYQNHQQQFEHDKEDVIGRGADHTDVFIVPFAAAGDTVFTRGSRLWHAVNPVLSGKRISVVLSLFSPVTIYDENPFWHIAAEDGLGQAVRNFRRLRRAQRNPIKYCSQIGVNLADLVSYSSTNG